MDLTYGQNWGESECKKYFGGENHEEILARRIWRKDITVGAVGDRNVVETGSGPYSMVDLSIYVEPTESLAAVLCRTCRFSKVSDGLVQQIDVTGPTCGISRSKSQSPVRNRSNYFGAFSLTTVHRTGCTTTSSSAGR
jgi:hypothetical protein